MTYLKLRARQDRVNISFACLPLTLFGCLWSPFPSAESKRTEIAPEKGQCRTENIKGSWKIGKGSYIPWLFPLSCPFPLSPFPSPLLSPLTPHSPTGRSTWGDQVQFSSSLQYLCKTKKSLFYTVCNLVILTCWRGCSLLIAFRHHCNFYAKLCIYIKPLCIVYANKEQKYYCITVINMCILYAIINF